MLQVARLASRQLAEAAPRVVAFLHEEIGAGGGARDRAGEGDLYYTAFALDALIALEREPPRERVASFLAGFGDGAELDLVHQACLVRCWAALGGPWPTESFAATMARRMEELRSRDGGYHVVPRAENGSLYAAFLALGLLQDLGLAVPEPARLAESIARLRAEDGGYANVLELPAGTTPSTAAAAVLLRQLGTPSGPEVASWLLARAQARGGFLATPNAPLPDLLSTATALHALASLDVSIDALREPCLDFVDSLWTGRAFVGTWDDDQPDSEYVFYALLALGHLSV
jgi:prenyltransferase beta subunit